MKKFAVYLLPAIAKEFEQLIFYVFLQFLVTLCAPKVVGRPKVMSKDDLCILKDCMLWFLYCWRCRKPSADVDSSKDDIQFGSQLVSPK